MSGPVVQTNTMNAREWLQWLAENGTAADCQQVLDRYNSQPRALQALKRLDEQVALATFARGFLIHGVEAARVEADAVLKATAWRKSQ